MIWWAAGGGLKPVFLEFRNFIQTFAFDLIFESVDRYVRLLTWSALGIVRRCPAVTTAHPHTGLLTALKPSAGLENLTPLGRLVMKA